MKTIIVTMENCEEVAGELVEELFDIPLRMVSVVTGPGIRAELRTFPEEPIKVMSGFSFRNGLLTIRSITVFSLKASRKISWDVSKEKVTVTYLDSGSIRIERKELGKEKVISRMIVKLI
ncbi:hypothetical protein AUJ42_03135 [Candidatus Collierbacteria bacterium CG1_02_44_10]|uniref:Uncharacterized protein n=4 Tax=Candidatus Collieribacteriota TaxID=1752725 RepID=A0A1J4RV98_9BACT|nr:hypothetical protein [bacterium]OIN90338.1 MAG: hypothetical protein AUJ42_03135 [Candidatus Collierbacteria bacterium CG1_02_44_10]